MTKIPVGQTIAEAYRFTFARLEHVIGVIWLPIIVLTIADYFVSGPYLTGMATAMDSGDMVQIGPLLAKQIVFGLFQLVLIAIIGVAITREILSPLQRPLFLRFSFGGTELRLVGAIISLYMLLFFLAFLLGIIGMILGGGSLGAALPAKALAPGQRAIGMAVLLALILSPLLIYVFVRLAYFVVPSVVMDGKFGLERSWQLAKGNVWRIVLITLAIVLPLVLVGVILQLAVLGPESLNPHMELWGNQAANARLSAEQMRQLAAHLPLLKGLEFVVAPFVYGLTFAAPAFAYKTLTAAAVPDSKQ